MNNVRNLFDQGLFISRGILLTAALFLFFVGYAAGATITFDKSLDVPDRDFTVTYEGSTFSFTVSDIGNYKIGEDIGVTVSGGVSNMRLVLFTVDKLTPWFKPSYGTSGSVSTTITADRFDSNCPDVCEDDNGGYKMGPGIYALVVQNRDDSKYFIAKPVIVSNYYLTATPNTMQVSPGSVIKVTVGVSKNGAPVSVAPNNVKVEFVQDSTSTHFGNNAVATATGTYEANIQIPYSASGSYRLYAAITTNRNIYQDYPETIGAASYSGTIIITSGTSSPTPSPTSTPTPTPTTTPTSTPAATHGDGGSGGGGGGSGLATSEPYTNIEKAEKYDKNLIANTPVTYTFKALELGVYEIAVTGKESENDIVLRVEALKGTSKLVTVSAPGTVYKHVNIWAGTKRIKEALIRFKVENSWLGSNSVAGSDVKMVRWDGSKWAQIEISEKTKDTTYTYYEAKTDTFSAFAITGLKGVVVPTATPAIEETILPTPTEAAVPTAVPTEKAVGIKDILSITTVVLGVIIIILAAVYLFKRKRG